MACTTQSLLTQLQVTCILHCVCARACVRVCIAYLPGHGSVHCCARWCHYVQVLASESKSCCNTHMHRRQPGSKLFRNRLCANCNTRVHHLYSVAFEYNVSVNVPSFVPSPCTASPFPRFIRKQMCSLHQLRAAASIGSSKIMSLLLDLCMYNIYKHGS